MNGIRTKVRRVALKTVTRFRQRQMKPSINTAALRHVTTVLMSVLCAAVIAYLHLLTQPAVPESSLSQNTEKQKTPAIAVQNHPIQANPLFATSPSWTQDFAYQKSALPDQRYWNILVGPAANSNKEQQYYTSSPANLRIENGALHLTATHGPQPEGYSYGSARIETQGKQSFLYGRIDITAKLPSGSGTWPAVWLLPANDTYAKKSPESNLLRYRNGGEIDILEAVGFEPGVVYGIAHTVSDLRLRTDGTGSYGTIRVPASSTSFNKYTLFWTPTQITFAVNDKVYSTYSRSNGADYTTWPFDQPFYLVANLAMGGSWGGMDTAHYPGNGIDNTALPASLDIRSIYYYPYIGSRLVK